MSLRRAPCISMSMVSPALSPASSANGAATIIRLPANSSPPERSRNTTGLKRCSSSNSRPRIESCRRSRPNTDTAPGGVYVPRNEISPAVKATPSTGFGSTRNCPDCERSPGRMTKDAFPTCVRSSDSYMSIIVSVRELEAKKSAAELITETRMRTVRSFFSAIFLSMYLRNSHIEDLIEG